MTDISREEFNDLRTDVKEMRKDFANWKDNHFHAFQEDLSKTHKEFDTRHEETNNKLFQLTLATVVIGILAGINIAGKVFLGW